MSNTQIIPVDFTPTSNPQHLIHYTQLMNTYISDEMGSGKPLTPNQGEQLFQLMQDCPNAVCFFVVHNNEYVGLANCFTSIATFSVGKCLNIHDVIIDPKHRGKGLSNHLFDHIIDYAKSNKIKKITLEVRYDNYKAQQLYKKYNFHAPKPPMHFWQMMVS